MSSNHQVTFRMPAERCNIYMITRFGYLPTYFYFDKDGRAVPASTFSYSNERIANGRVADAYGNKPVTHYYSSGTVDLALACLDQKAIELRRVVAGLPWIHIYNNGRFVLDYVALGSGKKDPGMCYSVVTSNTSSLFVCENYRPDGTLEATVQYTQVSIDVRDPWHYSAVYKKTVKYSAWGHEHGYRDYESLDYANNGHLILVGTSTDISVSKPFLIERLKTYKYSVNRVPLVPDTITDDIFSKFALPDVNNCENIAQLRDIKKSIPPILNLIRRRNIKSLAELYLWYKYTFKTSMLDIQNYSNFIKSYIEQSKSKTDCKHMSLLYTANDSSPDGHLSQVTRHNIYTNTYNGSLLELLGLDINLSNTWDLVPFSFVVDWFVNIGDILSTIDSSDALTHVKVYSVCTSNKCISTHHPFADMGILDAISHTMYTREVTDTLPVGNLSVSIQNPSRHILDGAALIFANKR